MARRSPWLEITIAYLALEIALWTERGTQQIASLVAAAVIIALTFLSRKPASELGLELPDLPHSLWPLLIGTGVALAIVLLATASGSLHVLYGSRAPMLHALLYFVWALVQQFILQSFFYVRVESALGNTWLAVVVTALLFAAAHIPNPVLVPATFGGALFFCGFFRKYRTIYPLAIAHGLLGLALAVSVPDSVMRHMRVGIAYIHYPF